MKLRKWYMVKEYVTNPSELSSSSVDRDIAFYMQGPGFEPWTLHFSTIKLCEFQTQRYLTKKKEKRIRHNQDD